MKKNNKRIASKQSGFTLIELLVVIGIVAILSVIVLASLNSARAKARDAARISNIKQVQKALDLYYSDNGAYPVSSVSSVPNVWAGNGADYGSLPNTGSGGYIPGLAPTYIKELPIDPNQTAANGYIYKSDGKDYFFMAHGTAETTVPTAFLRSSDPTSKDIAVYTPGLASATFSGVGGNGVAVLAVGDTYGGGKVAYILQAGDPGYSSTVQHGLISATADQSTGIIWSLPAYQSIVVPSNGAIATALGTGLANTNAIISQNGAGTTYAAGLARAYNGGGYSDWYLPSKDELNKLYLNKVAIGGFTTGLYWSSSEYSDAGAWFQFFSNGGQYGYGKENALYVRAVRAF